MSSAVQTVRSRKRCIGILARQLTIIHFEDQLGCIRSSAIRLRLRITSSCAWVRVCTRVHSTDRSSV